MSTSVQNSSQRAAVCVAVILILSLDVADVTANNPQERASRVTRRQPMRIMHGDVLDRGQSIEQSVVDDQPSMSAHNRLLDSDTLDPTPLGEHIANTSYDSQANDSQGHQIARNLGEDFVHMVWIHWDITPSQVGDRDRFVNYASWDVTGNPGFELYPGFDGVSIGLGDFARAGFVRLDIDSDNKAHPVFHQYPDPGVENYSAWHVYLPEEGYDVISPEQLPGTMNPDITETLWPDIAIAQNHGLAKDNTTDVYHVIGMGAVPAGGGFASPSGDIPYWRWDQADLGWNPAVIIDSCNGALSYVIDAADGTDKVAVAFLQNYESRWNGLFNLVYRESLTGGLGWVDGSELGNPSRQYVTNYTDNVTPGPQAWAHISIAYDHDAILHIIWDEQRVTDLSPDIAIRHWDDSRQRIDQIALGYYENYYNYPGHLNLNKMTLGIGDGSAFCTNVGATNENSLYITYTKNCGETQDEQADHSRYGFCNGELYITTSFDDGISWSKPINISNTKTPSCHSDDPDSVCASEVMATIARDISGQEGIDILYLQDLEAGTWADGSGWTINRLIYLNLPGGDDSPYICPMITPGFIAQFEGDPECILHATPGMSTSTEFVIDNTGNGALSGTITVADGGSWLSTVPSGAYTLTSSDPPLSVMVTMDASGLVEGPYHGEVRVTHNDSTLPNPWLLPIEFVVSVNVQCPEAKLVKTAEVGFGVLALEVANSGRFGAPNPYGGLFRHVDSSRAITDASLVIAYGRQGPDTIAYHRYGDNFDDPGQFGFLAYEPVTLDTGSYNTGAGVATATSAFVTRDFQLGVDVAWYAPQHPDSADFVIADYNITNRTDQAGLVQTVIDDILVGLWIDFDVIEGYKQTFQNGSDNFASYWPDSNLLYQYGADVPGHVPASYFNTSQRYSAGVTYISGRDANGNLFSLESAQLHAGMRNMAAMVQDGNPTSGWMYSNLTGGPGVTLPTLEPDSTKNLYAFLTLDQGLSLNPGERFRYVVGFVSDTLQHFEYGPAPGQSPSAGLHRALQSAWRWTKQNLLCKCVSHGDPVVNGVVDVLDVVKTVDIAFRSGPPSQSPSCLFENTDVNCSGATEVFDVVKFVDVAFRSANPTAVFCNPCA